MTNSLIEAISDKKIPIILQLLAIIIVILNLWLLSKLSPIHQEIAIIKANSESQDNRIEKEFIYIQQEIQGIDKKIDRIEVKLDNHMDK